MDRLTPAQRRKNMQHVRNKDSQIELRLRRALWHAGLRYRKNVRSIFGCPDVVFLRLKIAVFCDSEFWHGYDWERRKHDFKSRQDFWIPKIERNIARDREVLNSDRRLLNSTELHAAPIGAVFLYARKAACAPV